MEKSKAFSVPGQFLLITTLILIFSIITVNGQITTSCTSSMISSFTPCLNYVTGSSGKGSSPTEDCCDSLKSLISTNMDCACLILTGNVPFSVPFNQNLAISLPRMCNGGVPIKCKASAVQLPPPGPVLFGPTPAPTASSPSSPTPRASKANSGEPPPDKTTLETTPTPSSVAPTGHPGIKPVTNTNSASNPSNVVSPSLLIQIQLILGIMIVY